MIGGPENIRDMPDNDNNQVQISLKNENIAGSSIKSSEMNVGPWCVYNMK